MSLSLEIFSQGEEIVTGQVADTNAAWLSQQAITLGFTVTRHTAVGDKLADLVQVLLEIAKRADCCICTGGLGPTSDDLTAEAVSKAFNLPLLFDEIAFAQIEQFFRNRNRPMPECNRKQAMLPQGSVRLDNTLGTAPGFALQQDRCWFAFVPGVPSEMRHLFWEHIQPALRANFDLQPSKLITIKTIGIGESDLQERINKIKIPPRVQLGFRAELGQVQTKLLFPHDCPQAELESFTQLTASAIGDAVFAIEGLGHDCADIVAVISQLMGAKKYQLAMVESASHGLLAAKMVGMPWLLSAVYQQSLTKLTKQLGVRNNPDDIMATANSIARGVQKISGTNMVLVQLISDADSPNLSTNNSITIYNTLLANDDLIQTQRTLTGDIERKQQQSAFLSLDVLRRYLQRKNID